MSLIDDGQSSLEKMLSVTSQDLHPGSGRITELMFHPGLSMSVENFLEMMLVISDNTAADVVLREAGGPTAVTARMKTLGLPGIRVDRSTAQLISAWQGATSLPPENEWNRTIWDPIYNAVPQS